VWFTTSRPRVRAGHRSAPVWTGSITFGMVAIPVRLVPAVRRKSVSFHQLDSASMSRIKYRKVSEATGVEVPAERMVKAAEVSRGHHVVVTDEDLAPLAPAKAGRWSSRCSYRSTRSPR
jgi:DNA end-binding protein Ku